MRVFIAEKEIQAKNIAAALSDKQVLKPFYILCGDNDVVTWASGHLYRLAHPEEYDIKYREWKIEDLPIVPPVWRILPVKGRERQLEVIGGLIQRASQIVHSCDFDREGQLIGDQILLMGPKLREGTQILRLNMNGGHTKAAIRDALENLKPNSDFTCMSLSAFARVRADWMVGINLSRLYTVLSKLAGYKKGEKFTIGRVQTPTLAIIVNRDRVIEKFSSITHYVVGAILQHANGEIMTSWKPKEDLKGLDEEGRVVNKDTAENIVRKIKGRTGIVSNVELGESWTAPPLPHDVTSLQVQANRKSKLTAAQTSAAAQALYEKHKLISYPRSSCRYLPEREHQDAISVILAIAKNDPEKSIVCNNANTDLKSEAWNDSKLQSHHGIIPLATISNLSELTDNERIVYDLICRTYIAQFYPPAHAATTKLAFTVAGEIFECSQRDPIHPGWQVLYPSKNEQQTEKIKLPKVEKNDRFTCIDAAVVERKTSPPPRFDDALIMETMKNVEKFIEEEELRDRLAGGVGIGTEATRAGIVETLVERNYVERENTKIISTKLGRDLIDALDKESITSPGLTAVYEKILSRIEKGEFDPEIFVTRQAEIIKQMISTASVKPKQFILSDKDELPPEEDDDDNLFTSERAEKRAKKYKKQSDS